MLTQTAPVTTTTATFEPNISVSPTEIDFSISNYAIRDEDLPSFGEMKFENIKLNNTPLKSFFASKLIFFRNIYLI